MSNEKEEIVSILYGSIELIHNPESAFQLCNEIWKSSFNPNKRAEEISIFSNVLLLEDLGNKTHNEISKSMYFAFAGMISGELGVSRQNISYLNLAEAYFRLTNTNVLPNLKFEILFRIGRNHYYSYRVLRSKLEDIDIKFNYYKEVKERLLIAQRFIQYCFNKVIIEIGIKNNQLVNSILIHISLIAADLNRWVEFSYYLNLIPMDDRDEEYYSIKAINLEAYLENTHSTIYKSLIQEIVNNCNKALSFKQIEGRNRESVVSIRDMNQKLLGNIEVDDTDLEDKGSLKHTSYRSFCLENGLALNEHSIYCICGLSRRDNLKIRTRHKHTHKKWLTKFQMLIDQLQSDFDLARLSYFNSQQVSLKGLNLKTFKKQSSDNRILIDIQSRLLINSFKETYSILDRIAVSTISLFEEVESNRMYFHDFIDYIKNKVDIASKKYLIALESIAEEFYHQNEYATLKEYKQWRDAIEHNYFFLVKNKSDLFELEHDHKGLQHVTFADKEFFKKRTLHLMQLCRSAIFSLVFLIRDESCQRFFRHKKNSL